MIAASSSASTAAAKADPREAGTDTSPFALLLAATLQDTPTPQAQGATAPAATDTGTSAATGTDPETDLAEVTPPPVPTANDKGAVTQGSGKRDKKAEDDKSKDADTAASDQQALQTAQNQSIAAAVPPVVPQVAQTAPQTSQTNNSDSNDGDDLANAISAATAASTGNTGGPANPVQAGSNTSAGTKSVGGKTSAPQTPSQPSPVVGDDAEPVVPAPVATQAAIATDDSDTDDAQTVSSEFSAAAKAGAVTAQTPANTPSQPVGGSAAKTPATNRAVASLPTTAPSVASKPAAPQASAPSVADDDTDLDAQNVAAPAAPQAAQTAQIAVNAATDSDADISTDAAQASAPVPDVRNTAQANRPADKQSAKPVPSATNIAGPSPAPAAQSASSTPDLGDKETAIDKNSTLAQAASDAKSTHAAATDVTPQPVLPAPVVHAATPASAAPQGMGVVDLGGANQSGNTGNTGPTASVHLANAGTDATPDTNALAVSVAARSLSGARQFDIRLDPPELGHVEVRLSIDANGKTEAHMTADQPQTLSLLQKDAPNLTQALRDAGLDVSQGGLNFSLRGQDRQGGDKNNGAGQGRRTNLTATRSIGATQGPMPVSYNGAAADARVDIHV